MASKPLSLAECEGEHFVFTLNSNALSRANIPKGSRLLARTAYRARDDDLVVVETPEGEIVRFLRRCGSGFCLDARNPDIPPLVLSSGMSISGVVCAQLA